MDYKIIIIEDDKYEYQLLREKLAYYKENKTFKGSTISLHSGVSWIDEEKDVYAPYVRNLDACRGSIYIVDWHLKFKDGEKYPSDILNDLPKGFSKHDKYWIFYSSDAGYDEFVRGYLLEHFPSKENYDTPGKGNLTKEIDPDRTDFLELCLWNAIKFLSVKNQKEKTESIIKIGLKTSFYNIEEPDPFAWNIRQSEINVNPEKVICLAADSDAGVLIYEYADRINVYITYFTSARKGITKDLALTEKEGFFYNPAFFDKVDDRIWLKDIYRPSIHEKVIALKPEYKALSKEKKVKYGLNHRSKYTINIKSQLYVLRHYGVLPATFEIAR